MSLWGFLSISVIFGISFSMFAAYLKHKSTMKRLEIEALKVKNEDLKADIETDRFKSLESRVETLEAIVTTKRYDLDEKIKAL